MHVERPIFRTFPPLFHVHSPIGTKRHISAVEVSRQPMRCTSPGIVVDDLDDAFAGKYLNAEPKLLRQERMVYIDNYIRSSFSGTLLNSWGIAHVLEEFTTEIPR